MIYIIVTLRLKVAGPLCISLDLTNGSPKNIKKQGYEWVTWVSSLRVEGLTSSSISAILTIILLTTKEFLITFISYQFNQVIFRSTRCLIKRVISLVVLSKKYIRKEILRSFLTFPSPVCRINDK